MGARIQEIILELIKEIQKNETLSEAFKEGVGELIKEKKNSEETEIPVHSEHVSVPETKTDIDRLAKELNLKAQYVRRLNILRHYDLIGEGAEFNEDNIAPPSYEAVVAGFKPEELEIATRFIQPMLLIIPETSLAFKVKVLSACKEKVLKHETYINEDYRVTDTGPGKITGWRAVIVESAPEIQPYEGDNVNATFDERIKQRKATRQTYEKGMDRHRYCLLMMEAVRDGHPVDKKLFTLLDDDTALSETKVPAADFDPNNEWIRFNWRYPDDVNVCARFRPSVGGDRILS